MRSFHSASALGVMPNNTAIVPLWRRPDLFAAKRRVHAFIAEWMGITMAEAGVLMGPAVSAAKRWDAPLAKFEARSRTLGSLGLG